MDQNLREGFTLLELMVVVAVVAIIVAVAIPSLQASKKSAVEAKGVGMLKTVVAVQEQYKTRYGTYALDLFELTKMKNGKFKTPKGSKAPTEPPLESEFDLKEFLEIYGVDPQGLWWALRLYPTEPGVTADRSFFVDHTGVIRVRSDGPAQAKDPPID